MASPEEQEKKESSVLWRAGKARLLRLIRENETLRENLKKQQRVLLKLMQDQYFLFERLLSHEKPQKVEGDDEEDEPVLSGHTALQKRRKRSLEKQESASKEAGGKRRRRRRSRQQQEKATVDVDLSDNSMTASSSVQFSAGFSKKRTMPSLKRGGGARGPRGAGRKKCVLSVPSVSSGFRPDFESASNTRDCFTMATDSVLPGALFESEADEEEEELKIDEDSF